MRKFFAVTIVFSLLFLGLAFGIAQAQRPHGFQDQRYTAEHLREYGATMFGRGKVLREMGEAMMRAGEEGQKSVPLASDKGLPGGPQYMIGRGKMMKEMGDKMMMEGERMIKEAEASIWIEGGPGGPLKKK